MEKANLPELTELANLLLSELENLIELPELANLLLLSELENLPAMSELANLPELMELANLLLLSELENLPAMWELFITGVHYWKTPPFKGNCSFHRTVKHVV